MKFAVAAERHQTSIPDSTTQNVFMASLVTEQK
eukprot:CAMPEP_0178407966 /NCGR_PEP_ID=MMETSP0689_2-20121128/19696_1 /TAXON_ID=160604 /ORGANISM="Amphidinium massartii, Strain CS-259" /LENGTH=32 /DNA_ID= /DNA_START= /DNA_END= /DNA_ORIENTATION=